MIVNDRGNDAIENFKNTGLKPYRYTIKRLPKLLYTIRDLTASPQCEWVFAIRRK
jgi:hypothetical protein